VGVLLTSLTVKFQDAISAGVFGFSFLRATLSRCAIVIRALIAMPFDVEIFDRGPAWI